MTDSYQIGPITLSQAAIIDNRQMNWVTNINNTVYQGAEITSIGLHDDGMETFQLYLTSKQLFQLKNLRKLGEPVWINLAIDLDYYHMIPQGLYVIGNVNEEEYINYNRRLVSVTVKQLTNDKNDQLKYVYTTGENDGTLLETEYDTSTTVTTQWDEDFTTWDTTDDWYASLAYGLTSTSITATGGKATYTCTSTKINNWGRLMASSKHTYKTPVYFDFDLQISTTPTTYTYGTVVSFMDRRINTSGNPYDNKFSFIQCVLLAYPTRNELIIQRYIKGKLITLYTETLSTGVTRVDLTVLIDNNNLLTVTRDIGAGDVEIITDHNTTIRFNQVWIATGLYNNETSAHTGYIENFKVYTVDRGKTATFGNIISAPIGTSYLITPDSTRASEDGNIPIYDKPTGELFYNVDMATNMYKGAVKVWNNNNDESTYYQCFGSDEKFTTSSFKASNGLIQLTLTSAGVNFYYWNGSAYALLNTFTLGTINTIKLREVSSERCVIQINYTYWVLQRGKKHVLVYHESTDLGYTKKGYYYHDTGMGTMAEEAITGTAQDVEMLEWYYCNIYDTSGEDSYNLQIVKTYPQTIKNDTIPADEVTVIGWYHKGDTGYDTSAKLALEAHTWPDCNIGITHP